MSDPTTTDAAPTTEPAGSGSVAPAAPSPEPAGQPTEPTATPTPEPAAQPQIDPQEYAAIKRNADAYRGARPLIDKLVQHNIKSEADLQRFLELDEVARERNLDINQLTSVLRGQQPKPESQTQGQEQQFLTKDDLVSTLDQRDAMSQFSSELSAMDSAAESMRREVAEATGVKADDPVFSKVVSAMLNDAQDRNYYPPDHALHNDRLKPLDASQIAQIKQQAIESITAFRGQQAVASANSALASIPTQPSGNGMESRPGEGVSQIYNPHARQSQADIADAESILARSTGSTQPGVVANSV